MELPKGWYAALGSNEIFGGKPTAIRRFGRDLVAWRDSNGTAVVMEDSCPHRSVKLSLGSISNGKLVCPFHGFQYASDGSCSLVPETDKAAPNLQCQIVPTRERYAFIWLWYGPPGEATGDPPWFDELTDDFAWSQFKSSWSSHITRCIENQLDYAHLPYVHATTIGGGFDLKAGDRRFELDQNSIKLRLDDGHFQFKFPNIWSLQIVPKKFYQFLAFVPIDEEQTLLYVRAYQKFVTVPLVRRLVGLIMDIQSRAILVQDKRVVLSHPRKSSTLATAEKLYPSDRGIIWFRKCWAENSVRSHI
jgi:phenylpropionate dioxygenase-like ring-hydroxylating dioxygenase large terminal subunit